jgi:uncharacterized repeat protein (TIGR02543 family)
MVTRRLRILATLLLALGVLLGNMAFVPARHALAAPTGMVWSWGGNAYGQLGDGTKTGNATPRSRSTLTGVTGIGGGWKHAVAVKADGTVQSWGGNNLGQLGNGTNCDGCGSETPGAVKNLGGVTAIAAGTVHSLALMYNGTVRSWGNNCCGELGRDPSTTISNGYRVSPNAAEIPNLGGVVAIAAGANFSLALKSDGTVWAWGNNYYGQLGNGTFDVRDQTFFTPTQVGGLTGVTAIAAGGGFALAVKSDGTVWAWGLNSSGLLGTPTARPCYGDIPCTVTPGPVDGLTGVVAIEAGDQGSHSLALKADGTVWAWGANAYGQLGDGTNVNSALPRRAANLSGVTAIAAGTSFSMALKSDGTVRAWGRNTDGQLGNGTTDDSFSPLPVGNLTGVVAIAAGHNFGLAVGAQFFTLGLTATTGGSASAAPVAPAYAEGSIATLTAAPIPGYTFTGWTIDGAASGATNPYALTMDANHTVIANFVPVTTTYTLSLTASAGGRIAASPSGGTFAAGSVVTLVPQPESGMLFTGWTVDGVASGAANPYALTMNANHTVAASFAPTTAMYTLTFAASTGGGIGASPPGGTYAAGSLVTLTPQPMAGMLFTGWTVDGVFRGWANPLTVTMGGNHTVAAAFAPRPLFPDVSPGDGGYEAIGQLAARGVIRGYADGTFGPDDTTLRAQMAALIARAMGWDSEDWGNGFTDRGAVDGALWRNVGTLAHHDVARGFGDGSYRPADDVLGAQVVSFITRAMVAKGYWSPQPNNPGLYPNVPLDSGHRQDLATYVHYAGALPATAPGQPWAGWDQPSTRVWFAMALWQALNSYFGASMLP